MNTVLIIVLIICFLVIGICIGGLYGINEAHHVNDSWLEFSTEQLKKVSKAYEEEIEKLKSEIKELRGSDNGDR